MHRVHVVAADPSAAALAVPVVGYLDLCGLDTSLGTSLRASLDAAAATGDPVVLFATAPDDEDAVLAAAASGVPFVLAGPTLRSFAAYDRVAEAVGVMPGGSTPEHEVRVRPGPEAGQVAHRTGGDVVLRDRVLLVDKVDDHTDVLLTANVGFVDHAVATCRGTVATFTLGSTPACASSPGFLRLLLRVLRRVSGVDDGAAVRVGMLGYGAVGHEHSAALRAVEGLELAAVCDRNPERIDAARAFAPDLRAVADAHALLADDAVDLVLVSTPPNTHASWVLRALEAGKSVVVEKPFCITVDEADAQITAAAERGLTLAVYQNRRWDADYLALRRMLRAGGIGDVFHYESFVGGHGHPCNYWHSDETVSGGAIYDWGSHYLDWVLDLFPQPVEWVSATTHKRVWHDVTNADHTRTLIHFAGGLEAEFTHSDLAAAMKPKWYVLGTEGAVVGSWRQERVVRRDAVGNLAEDSLTAAESPARLSVHHADGSVTELAVPAPPAFPFHRELADHMLMGTPMSVTPLGSRRNIAVMQAATESAALGGRQVGVRA